MHNCCAKAIYDIADLVRHNKTVGGIKMRIAKTAGKTDLTKIEVPNIEVTILFDKTLNFLRHYSVHVHDERLKDVGLVDSYGTLKLVTENKKLLSYAQNLDNIKVAGIYFTVIHPFSFDTEKHYLVYIDNDTIYLLQLDSQFDVATVYRQMRGDELRKLAAC